MLNQRSLGVALLIAMVSANGLALAEDQKAAEASPSRNAALVYWLALDQLDETMADKARADLVDEYSSVKMSDEVEALVKDDPSLELLRIGSAFERCDWGTDSLLTKQGPALLLPYLSKERKLAKLAMLQARWHLAQGRSSEAADNVVAVFRLGRHSEQDGLIINMLVGYSLQSLANTFLADHFSQWSDDDLKKFRQQFARAPKHLPMRDGIRTEKKGMVGWFRALLEGKARPLPTEAFAKLGDLKDPAIRKVMLGYVDDLDKVYGEMETLFDLPRTEFRKAYEVWEQRVRQSKNPLVLELVPALGSMYDNFDRVKTLDQIMQAAITLKLEGQVAFDAIKDPYGDGPFAIQQSDEEVKISSKLVVRGEAVSMRFKRK